MQRRRTMSGDVQPSLLVVSATPGDTRLRQTTGWS
jgi:hypothetical protein